MRCLNELNALPKGWVWETLGGICEKPQYGWTTKANKESGQVRLLRTTDITSGSLNWATVPFCTEVPEALEKYLLQGGDIVISRAGSVGVSFLLGTVEKAVFASYLIRFRVKEQADKKYVYYFLQSPSYWDTIGASKSGIAIPNVNAKKLAQVLIPIAPLEQQKRIVAEIEKQFSRLDKAVASLKRVKTNLKRYKAAVLKAAVEGKLTEEWRKQHPDVAPADKLLEWILVERREKWQGRGNYKEPAAPDITNLPELPEGWVWATMPQLGELNRGKSKHRPRNDPKLYGGEYPFIQTGDVRHATGKIKSYSQTYSDTGLSQSRLWPIGTLCITIAANIADTALLDFDACFPDSIVGFLSETEHVDVHFIEYFIRTAKENLERFAPATAQKNINLEILKAVAVPLPPEKEQKAIVFEIDSKLSVVERIEDTVNANFKRADRLRQAILKKAFSGQLVAGNEAAEPGGET